MSTEPKEDEIFDPFKGYEDDINENHQGHKDLWFATSLNSTISRNALYQGFITEWEFTQISAGRGVFLENGGLRWIQKLPGMPEGPYPEQLLTRSRIDKIKADLMLGIGDGKTSI